MDTNQEFPQNLLTELHFEELYLTPKQETRLEEVIAASMPFERNAFDKYYVFHKSLEQIAKEESRDTDQIMKWIAKIATNVEGMKEYILTGKY